MDFLGSITPLALIALAALAWTLAGWLRVYRLARYFQLEGYDSRRFLRWLARNDAEGLYVRICLLGNLLMLVGACFIGTLSSVDIIGIDESGKQLSSLLAIANLLLAGVMIKIRPLDHEVKQAFTPTQRAMRLVISAFVLTAIPIVGLFIWSILSSGDSIVGAFCGTLAGILAFHLAPLTLSLANLLMWPVEEVFRQSYLRLAKQHLKRSGATVIAITGSYGKTSTKHYLKHILDVRYRVLMTPKSYNTLLGISRVINDILAKDVSYDYFLVEAGAFIPGEIARICKLVEPRISLVIAVGPMHLERFGSIDNVVKAKYEIIQALPPDGLGVFNADDPNVRGMADRGYPSQRFLVTRQDAPGAQLAASNVRMTADGLDFDVCDNQTGEQRSMHAPLYGEHNVTNILMAMAVARHLGLSLAEIALRVATLEPAEHRLHRRVMPGGVILIDDAYSANPVGTQTALDVLALQTSQPGARRVVVSSGMFELGPLHEAENRKLGERIAQVATDVILMGAAQTKPVVEGLHSQNFPPDRLHVVDTLAEAVAIYRPLLRPGDALLMLTDLPDTYA